MSLLLRGGAGTTKIRNFSFEFVIILSKINDHHQYVTIPPSSVPINDLIEWYKEHGEESTEYQFRSGCRLQKVTYHFVKKQSYIQAKVTITYSETEHFHFSPEDIKDNELVIAQIFCDPDASGNYPISKSVVNVYIKGEYVVDSITYSF